MIFFSSANILLQNTNGEGKGATLSLKEYKIWVQVVTQREKYFPRTVGVQMNPIKREPQAELCRARWKPGRGPGVLQSPLKLLSQK